MEARMGHVIGHELIKFGVWCSPVLSSTVQPKIRPNNSSRGRKEDIVAVTIFICISLCMSLTISLALIPPRKIFENKSF